MAKILIIVSMLVVSLQTARSQDTTCGIAWGPIINISGPPPYAFEPHIAAQGETIHATWLQDPGGFRLPYARSLDGGLTWEPVREMLTDTALYNRPVNDPWVIANNRDVFLVFVGPHSQGNTPVYIMRSSDRGTTWSQPQAINSEITSQVHHATLKGDTLVVGYPRSFGDRRIARSTNGGASWDTSLAVVRVPVEISQGKLHSTFRTGIGSVFEIAYKRSTDLGDSWQDSSVISVIDNEYSNDPALGISRGTQPGVLVTWRDTKYGCETLVGCSIILRRSTDGGAVWLPEALLTEQPNGYNNDLTGQQISSNGNTVVVTWTNDLTGHINMRYTINSGDTWSELCDVTPHGVALIPSCTVTPTAIHVVWEDFIGGFWGIYYRRGVIISTSFTENAAEPQSFTLYQNYPNPFNPKTTIRFRISPASPEGLQGRGRTDFGTVTLRIYDLLGREVVTLVNEKKGPGIYEVPWDASDFPSGVYIYRLSAVVRANRVRSLAKSMILLK